MVATASLRERGFRNVVSWIRGVDLTAFHPGAGDPWPELPRPVFLYVRRVAVAKNIGAFLDLDLPGSKVVVGGGPQLADISKRYTAAHFTGPKFGEELARCYGAADVSVFPRTDTFGLVLLEALACGMPVAAYPVVGPIDMLADTAGHVGAVGEDLRVAAWRRWTRAARRAGRMRSGTHGKLARSSSWRIWCR